MTTEQHKGEHTSLDLLKVGSKDIFTDNISKIGQLFPEVLTEKRDEHGRLRPAIDFEKLKQFLSEEIVDGRESYEFTWVGKREAIAEAGRPTTKTLRPDLGESVDFDKSENIFITGDNLEVLKILQESYLGKIDMIYIDPPYNTGKDFVYSDKFQKTDEELKEEMDLLDEEGRQVVGLTKNEKSSARYHSDWLNMMYPRLRLARNLLKDSGVIFISIDDNEQANLKVMCDEIFGEENFRNTFLVRRRTKSLNLQFADNGLRSFNVGAEFILAYSKTTDAVFNPVEKLKTKVSTKGSWNVFWSNADRPSMRYELLGFSPKTGQWRWSKEKAKEAVENYEEYLQKYSDSLTIEEYSERNPSKRFVRRIKNGSGKNGGVQYFVPPSNYSLRTSNWTDLEVSQIAKEFDLPFENPKNIELVKEILKTKIHNKSIVLDFFGGSGTTADAVMRLNASESRNCKFILCTLDEEVADKSAAKEAGYETIDQISRERIRRAAAKIQEEHPELVGKQDFGFKAYKLDSSNFKDVSARPDQFIQGELFDSVSNIKEGRSGLDLLFQVMLTWGMELSLAIDSKKVAGAEVYDVDQGSLMACFEDDISEEVIRYIAQAQPLRAVFRDRSFAHSTDKINISEIFKELSPNTKVKVV